MTPVLHHPQPFSGNMLSQQHRLMGHPMSSREERHCPPLQMDDTRSTAYAQNLSRFMARPDLNSALSSNGSTYCESDSGSLEPFDEPFNAHTELAHHSPKGSGTITKSTTSFLSSTEETSPLSSFGSSDSPMNHLSFTSSPAQILNTANYNMGASSIHQNGKPLDYDNPTPWPCWKTAPTSDIWYPTDDFNNTSDTSAWHNQTQYSAPWSIINNNTYNRTEVFNGTPGTNPYTINNTPMFPSSHPQIPISLPSSLPMASHSYPPTPAHTVPSLDPSLSPSYPNPIPTQSLSMYQDPSFTPPLQNQTILTPSSLSRSPTTSSSEPSPHRSKSQRGIEASIHYSDERNAFLIDCKRRGLSYKDIKRIGGFKEAESTLRGRYRTLTKSKEQRVRKPKWLEKDIRLLCEAVALHAERKSSYSSLATVGMGMNEPPKVSWKKVAEHIWSRGVLIILGMRLVRRSGVRLIILLFEV
ncbi:hypothetical protein N7535_008097 [Penicillium sp. DV-2018c]|nr:hypothetical protein N7461_004133 [Penicillium sp. DV-2018c]KAJ5566459.1 hypothetical protein N7535_008097 [Penicillium sp. DV-2018c]